MLRAEWPDLRVRLVNARFSETISHQTIRQCETLAAELGLLGAIEWYTDFLPVARINALLSECDALVLPYDESSDSASGAVRIAFASLVPVVATRVKIFEELLDSVAWADSNTPAILAEEIGALLKSPQQREMLQKNMIDWLAIHDWAHLAKVLGGMIESLTIQKSLGFGN
jgi:glycosyltransferase involved in cell wall biosynthesis